MKKGCFWAFIVFLVLALVGTIWGFFSYYYVISDGTKSGILTDFTKKGKVFKTYEGKMVMEGLKNRTAGSIETNELLFSVENEKVADLLAKLSGKNLQLHYYRYNNPIFWRGDSDYVVDSIVSVDYIPVHEYFDRLENGTLNSINQPNFGGQMMQSQPQAVTYEEAVRQLNQAQQELQRAQMQLQQILQQQSTQNVQQQLPQINTNVQNNGTAAPVPNGMRQYKSPAQN